MKKINQNFSPKRSSYTLRLGIMTLLISSSSLWAQKEAQIFTKYKKDATVLPDFSYAGYHNGEKDIPINLKYKVFDVTTFGAIPNDNISDKTAIQKAVKAANENGSGIVFFPKGRFLINADGDDLSRVISKSSNIIFRGSGSEKGGTELFMKNTLQPADPKKMWTVPSMFSFTSEGSDKKIGEVSASAKVGCFDLVLNSTKGLKKGDWIVLTIQDNNPELLKTEFGEIQVNPTWTYLTEKGLVVKVYHQISAVKNNTIKLVAPISYPIDAKYKWEVLKFANSQEVGIEDIAFVGNWKDKFVHHQSWVHDSGFSMINISKMTNSWLRNCRFTDVSAAASIGQSANVTVLNCKITGNGGHSAISSGGGTNVLIAKCIDEASQWHSFGASHYSMNTVIWKCVYPATTCFESHSSQPRNTLLDGVTGGFMKSRGGGSIFNMPNHMQGLVLWNYTQSNEAVKDFEFWPPNEVYWKILKPTVVGFKSEGTTFNKEQIGYAESLDGLVEPASLYTAQLKLRLKTLPHWIKELE
ncbi:DUF4955 domain-containing protein [Flavobacterium sp.]|uniref:DUF4955 domain-containing protein n=1 Tax=Flavobacterium sp. TaxID=239 RepID=UPI003C602CAE